MQTTEGALKSKLDACFLIEEEEEEEQKQRHHKQEGNVSKNQSSNKLQGASNETSSSQAKNDPASSKTTVSKNQTVVINEASIRQAQQHQELKRAINSGETSKTSARQENENQRNVSIKSTRNNKHGDGNKIARSKINYWDYKQTGIKSRQIKLLKHPIEHIERKIVITYLIGFLFKLIAIATGPLIITLAYLLIVPSILIRRSIWFLLNIKCLFNARIRTIEKLDNDNKGSDDNENLGEHDEAQIYWNYCPFTYLETFWFKKKLVNNVILVIDNDDNECDSSNESDSSSVFSIEKFRALVRESILSKPVYRKFQSKVVPKGIPFYKSNYWHYLELANEDDDLHYDADAEEHKSQKVNNPLTEYNNVSMEQLSFNETEQFSITSFDSFLRVELENNLLSGEESQEAVSNNDKSKQEVHILMPSDQQEVTNSNSNSNSNNRRRSKNKVYLSDHIYVDYKFMNEESVRSNSTIDRASIRRHAHNLMNVSLNMSRPLWEIRVIPTSKRNKQRTYLIFRCHQSLADGHSLSKILLDHIIEDTSSNNKSIDDNNNKLNKKLTKTNHLEGEGDIKNDELVEEINDDDDDDSLKPIKEKSSFISKTSKSDSFKSSILVAPLTILLWVIWTFTRRKNNHLNKCVIPSLEKKKKNVAAADGRSQEEVNEYELPVSSSNFDYHRRFYMTNYDLTKFYQIKQMTRSTVSDVILCALSGALREYLIKFNGVSNPPNLNVSLTVNMRQPDDGKKNTTSDCSKTSLPSNEKEANLAAAGGLNNEMIMINQDQNECNDKNNKINLHYEEPQVNCTLVNVPLPISVEGTVPRLWELRTTMDELRTSADPWVMLNLKKFLFLLLPIKLYQWCINYVALRNSSMFVSNIRGPKNMVEGWCVDLLQRAIFEAQQPPKRFPQSAAATTTTTTEEGKQANDLNDEKNHFLSNKNSREIRNKMIKLKKKLAHRSKLNHNLGSLSGVYYCMQPPTSEIPISFNCITYHNKLFVTSLTRSLLVEDSKLLIRLFFAQLNQLANTIAKRKSFITITRTLIPIEISCHPASPTLDSTKSVLDRGVSVEENRNSDIYNVYDDDHRYDQEEDKENSSKQIKILDVSSSNNVARAKNKFSLNLMSSPSGEQQLNVFDKEQNVQSSTNLSGQQRRVVTQHSYIKDDIEARTSCADSKCLKCNQSVCVCRRRKSLFSLDVNQRSANLLSLLHPNYYIGAGSSGSGSSQNTSNNRAQNNYDEHQFVSECLCGQQLLEELDEEQFENNNPSRESGGRRKTELYRNISSTGNSSQANDLDLSSVGSRTPSDDGGRQQRINVRISCPKCRYVSMRSTLSLNDDQQQQQNKYWQQNRQHNDDINKQNTTNGSNFSLSSGGHNNNLISEQHRKHNSAYLIVPYNSNIDRTTNTPDIDSNIKGHSKSETDLLPMKKIAKHKRGSSKRARAKDKSNTTINSGNKDSWLAIGRKSHRKITSIFPKSSNPNANTNYNNSDSNSYSLKTSRDHSPVSLHLSRGRNLIESSLDLINTHIPSKRRQSVATTTGTSSNIHRSIVVKDEINADVSLRYQLDGPILGIRNRRFSTIGSAVVGNQRRASLIPFGLINKQSFPKLLWDDGEAHL